MTFSTILAGRPGKLQKIYNVKSHAVKFGERIRNCEDVLLDESTGIAFLSCDPGRDRWNTVMVSNTLSQPGIDFFFPFLPRQKEV